MSRVYDALRRAADEHNGGRGTTLELPADTDFANESFPAEVAQARRIDAVEDRPVASPRAVPAPAAVTIADPAVAPEPASIRGEVPESFDRIAVRYEGKTVMEAEVAPQTKEQYRRLAAGLHHAQAQHGTRVVMVTSALVGEGKTLTASNLALTLSQSYQKEVLLIDADLRRPSLQAVFGIRSGAGLSEGLTSAAERAVPVNQVSERLGILQAGRPTSDPIAAITSERMRRLINEARKQFDWIIIDTPPVALLTDANLMAAMTDGALIVVKAGQTPYELVERAVEAVGRERALGIVLNHAERPLQGTGYYDYYYGGAPK